MFIILALLQFVAPLVHAHSNGESSGQGFHLPGYEHYSVKSDRSEFHEMTQSSVADYPIISIGVGIKNKTAVSAYTPSVDLAKHHSLLKSADLSCLVPFLQLTQVHISVAYYTPLHSRAPPV